MSKDKSYLVEVREALCWTVQVNAENKEEAERLAQERCAGIGVLEQHVNAKLDSRYLVMTIVRDVFNESGAPLKRYRVSFNEYEAYEAVIEATSEEEAGIVAARLLNQSGTNPPFELVHNDRDELCVEEVLS